MKKCRYCGTDMDDDWNYCPACQSKYELYPPEHYKDDYDIVLELRNSIIMIEPSIEIPTVQTSGGREITAIDYTYVCDWKIHSLNEELNRKVGGRIEWVRTESGAIEKRKMKKKKNKEKLKLTDEEVDKITSIDFSQRQDNVWSIKIIGRLEFGQCTVCNALISTIKETKLRIHPIGMECPFKMNKMERDKLKEETLKLHPEKPFEDRVKLITEKMLLIEPTVSHREMEEWIRKKLKKIKKEKLKKPMFC